MGESEAACDELPTAKWNTVLTTILGLLLSLIACTTNVLILLAIYKTSSLHSMTNYFLAALAFGDFFVGFVALPLWVTRALLGVADEDHPVSIAVDCVYVFSVAVSSYNLCAVSIERYVGVVFPLRYNAIVTVARLKSAIAAAWVVSGLIACLRLLVHEDVYWIIAVCTVLIVPGVFISYCYLRIFRDVRRQLRSIGGQTAGSALVNHLQNKKASITVAIIIGVFYLTALPVLAFSIAEVVSHNYKSCQKRQSFESWGVWALFMAYSNAALNPWIYAARKKEFRDALKLLMFWKQHE